MNRFRNSLLILVFMLGVLSMWAVTLNVGPGQTYTTIQAAITNAVTGDIIVLHDDFEILTPSYMHANGYALMISQKSITIDLNGHSISSAGQATIYISASGALILTDTSRSF